jgi:uncharacterized membrane protein (DUF485 family)
VSARATELLMLAGAFLGGTLAAEALGAANTGIAMTFGQVAFAICLVAILLLRR